MKPKKIVNEPSNSVDECIQGLLYQYPNHYKKLENHPVLLLASLFDTNPTTITTTTKTEQRIQQQQQQRVHILSGGGSGHEPSHAGWIGTGMLSGVICGGIFASPSVSSILSAILRVSTTFMNITDTTTTTTVQSTVSSEKNTENGILLIVKNYTGDRLNFGMAAERANSSTYNNNNNNTIPITVKMVVVADDCALSRTKGITGARGVAGTIFVHKIAGAAAASGMSLDEVVQIATITANRCGTLGIALNSVTVPGAERINDRLSNDNTIEIGLGIHGEAGMKQSSMLSSDEMAREMISTIQNHGRVVVDSSTGTSTVVPMFKTGDEVCILVNNLGGTSNFEMSIFTKSCIELLESNEYNVKARRIYVGSYMTSFDMHGVSLTILNVSGQEELISYLDAPTNAPAWTSCDIWNMNDTVRPSMIEIPDIPIDDDVSPTEYNIATLPAVSIDNFANIANIAIIDAVTKLASAEPILTKYDTIVGDGDCGITMKRGATEILSQIHNGTIITTHPIPMFIGLANAVSKSMGGTSGILIEIMLRKIGSSLRQYGTIGVHELCESIQLGVDAVCLYGGAHVGSRTMLDALIPAADTLLKTNDLIQARNAAKVGSESTTLMDVASAGRSNYLSGDTLIGTPDPGAVAVAIVFDSLAETCG